MDVSQQHRLVQEKFTKQAERWGQMEIPPDLQEILSRIEVVPNARILDVAAGTGLLSRALSVRAKEIIATDITPAMLDRGREAAAREGISNVRFLEAPAENLPFEDGSFDLAVTRFSLHHISDPQRVVDEMVRVARGRGRVAIIDMIAPDDPQLARRFNEVERIRDASHARSLSFAELKELVEKAGARVVDSFRRDRTLAFDEWVSLSGEEVKNELRAIFEEELHGGAKTGFDAYLDDGKIAFHRPVGVVVAT